MLILTAAAQVEESDSLEQVRPEIVIDGQTIEVEERQAIVLPCLVDHLGEIDIDNKIFKLVLINKFSGGGASAVESS